MGWIKKKELQAIEPSKSKVHKKITAIAALSSKIPPVIKEAAVEEDTSNYEERKTKNNNAAADNSIKTDKSHDRTFTYEKSADSRTRNSYSVPESSHSSRQNVQKTITRTNSVPDSIRSSGRNSSVQSLTRSF
ncbi:uncharacterized protein LOC123672923 isoform X2 [Harmonia axyridis]|uniref:uncharacterized protein LOC123672923 isoform X2 n=1 Tax=Harmonia axyridis TaxID=115357 RepID=UPI001E278512|nr:uncharacterized protein LOC123672923 isoform X2 [Harmonia axyridis]